MVCSCDHLQLSYSDPDYCDDTAAHINRKVDQEIEQKSLDSHDIIYLRKMKGRAGRTAPRFRWEYKRRRVPIGTSQPFKH